MAGRRWRAGGAPLGALGVGLLAWMFVLAAPTPAWADVAPEPGPSEGPESLCEPDQEAGDACTTDDGDDGTCSEDTESCAPPPDYVVATCHICDEDCSVAAVGQPASRPFGGLTTGMVALLGLLLLRRRRK